MARALCRDHRGSWLFFLHKSVPVPPRFTLANGHQPRCASFSLLARSSVSCRETWLLRRSLRSFARAVSEVVPCIQKKSVFEPVTLFYASCPHSKLSSDRQTRTTTLLCRPSRFLPLSTPVANPYLSPQPGSIRRHTLLQQHASPDLVRTQTEAPRASLFYES